MAEFIEIIKTKQRMCDSMSFGCSDCELSYDRNGTGCSCDYFVATYAEKAEKIIMDWAKEHPIKTNAQKFKEVFGFEIDKNEYCNMISCDGICSKCKYEKGFWDKEYKEPKGE